MKGKTSKVERRHGLFRACFSSQGASDACPEKASKKTSNAIDETSFAPRAPPLGRGVGVACHSVCLGYPELNPKLADLTSRRPMVASVRDAEPAGNSAHRALPTLDPAAVDALRDAVTPLLLNDQALFEWCTTKTVERFLRADRGNLQKATTRLTETLKWRQEVRPGGKMCTACFSKDLRSHYMQHVGWDKLGRALVYSDIGMARDKGPTSNAEHCMQVLELLEPQLNPFPNDQYVWVVDFHKFGLADMSPKVAGACLSLFGKSYPERLGGMIIVGAPMLFNGLYRAVCAFADPVTGTCGPGFPKSRLRFISQLVTVQTDYGDYCPYIVQYTRYIRPAKGRLLPLPIVRP